MGKILFLTAITALATCVSMQAMPGADGNGPEKTAVAETDTLRTPEDSLKKGYSAIITDEAESSRGFMTIHKVKSTYYLEIPDSLMGKPMLLASRVSAISDNKDAIAGQMPGNGAWMMRRSIFWMHPDRQGTAPREAYAKDLNSTI